MDFAEDWENGTSSSSPMCFGCCMNMEEDTSSAQPTISDGNNETLDIATANNISEPLLERIYNFLNYGDLMAARKVCQRWTNVLGHSEYFLLSTILNLTLESQNMDMISKTIDKIPWRQARLQFFDFDNNRLEQPFNPPSEFFVHITHLEFHQCFVTWTSVKKYIAKCPKLEELSISRCIIHEVDDLGGHPNVLTETEEADCLAIFKSLKCIIIHDVNEIGSITRCLVKLNSHFARSLQTIKINFWPYVPVMYLREIVAFYRALTQLLEFNTESLKHLILDIRSNELLNRFCPLVLRPLHMSKNKLNLHVFKLTPSYPDCGKFGVNHDAGRSLEIFIDFLSYQEELKSFAFPHFCNMTSADNKRLQIVDCLTNSLEKLRVPGQIYLRRNFLKVFSNLKYLFIGDKCGVGRSSMLNPTRFAFDVRGGLAKKTCENFYHLSAYAKINYESGKLYHLIEKFPHLSCFEFDGMKPVLNDRDMQAIIKSLPMLQSLSITSCDFISDYGVTGIRFETCLNMNRLSTIYTESENIANDEKIVKSQQCISALKGLRKLLLLGKSRISDVGLSLGFRFLELKRLHLPWNERMTEWGIVQIGKNNPSLEIINMTAALASTSLLGFTQLIHTHPRIRRRHCRVQTIHMFQEDSISNPSLLTAILWDNSNTDAVIVNDESVT